jgi:hypothetical protein
LIFPPKPEEEKLTAFPGAQRKSELQKRDADHQDTFLSEHYWLFKRCWPWSPMVGQVCRDLVLIGMPGIGFVQEFRTLSAQQLGELLLSPGGQAMTASTVGELVERFKNLWRLRLTSRRHGRPD